VDKKLKATPSMKIDRLFGFWVLHGNGKLQYGRQKMSYTEE
jgi:hypothetical protein